MKTIFRIASMVSLLCVLHPAAQSPARYGGKNGWYKGNSHLHTNRVSGGDLTPSQAAKWYHDNDYDFIVLTEHRVFLGDADAQFTPRRQGFLIISGEEFNSLTGYGNNHATIMNASGPLGDIAPGADSHVEFFNRVYDLAVSKGGYPFINHPNWARPVNAEQFMQFKGYLHFELFNGCADTDNFGMYGTGAPALEPIWDTVLTRGAKYFGVGSDDFHEIFTRPGPCNPGSGFTMLKAKSPAYPDILDAYRKGRFYATSGVILKDLSNELGLYKVSTDSLSTLAELMRRDTARFANSARPVAEGPAGFRIDFIGPNGQILKAVSGDSASFQATNNLAYVRAKVTYRRKILPGQAPYDNTLHQADYVKAKGLDWEEFYAWGQPYFTDTRREGPALVFGCTDPAFLEFDPKANVMERSRCKISVSIRQTATPWAHGENGYVIRVGEEYGPYSIEVRSLSGGRVRRIAAEKSRTHVLSGLAPLGIFILEIKTAKGNFAKRIRVP